MKEPLIMIVKYILIIAAVLAGDAATTDPHLELVTKLFDSQADCERARTASTGEGKGEIEGKRVLRIVGRCQELTPEEIQQLRRHAQTKASMWSGWRDGGGPACPSPP